MIGTGGRPGAWEAEVSKKGGEQRRVRMGSLRIRKIVSETQLYFQSGVEWCRSRPHARIEIRHFDIDKRKYIHGKCKCRKSQQAFMHESLALYNQEANSAFNPSRHRIMLVP